VVALLLSLSAFSEAQSGGEEGFGFQKNCRSFKCPDSDETPVPKSPMDYLVSKGCAGIGASGFAMMGLNSNSEVTRILSSCCDLYHSCLQICGAKKQFCTSNAEKCMVRKCNSVPNERIKKQCLGEYETKKLMFQFSECQDFELAQRKSCDCVKKDSVDEKRAEVVRSFYAKFNPDNVDKANALAAKATDKHKLVGLLYKLVEKYPKAINIKMDDSKQQKMEDLLKDIPQYNSRREPKPDYVDVDDQEEIIDDERIEL